MKKRSVPGKRPRIPPARKSPSPRRAALANPTFELRLQEVRCLDVNDGFLNGRTDRIYLVDHLAGIDTRREHQLGTFKKGTKRAYPSKLLMEPRMPTSFRLKMMEADSTVSGHDFIGEFSVDVNGRIRAGKSTRVVTPPSAPANQTVLSMTGSDAKYVVTLAVRGGT
jgi:hypothetical protein